MEALKFGVHPHLRLVRLLELLFVSAARISVDNELPRQSLLAEAAVEHAADLLPQKESVCGFKRCSNNAAMPNSSRRGTGD